LSSYIIIISQSFRLRYEQKNGNQYLKKETVSSFIVQE